MEIMNLLRTELESTVFGGGRDCLVGATMGWAASVFPLIVAIYEWIETVTERRKNEDCWD
jgi:hypothetical protein